MARNDRGAFSSSHSDLALKAPPQHKPSADRSHRLSLSCGKALIARYIFHKVKEGLPYEIK